MICSLSFPRSASPGKEALEPSENHNIPTYNVSLWQESNNSAFWNRETMPSLPSLSVSTSIFLPSHATGNWERCSIQFVLFWTTNKFEYIFIYLFFEDSLDIEYPSTVVFYLDLLILSWPLESSLTWEIFLTPH